MWWRLPCNTWPPASGTFWCSTFRRLSPPWESAPRCWASTTEKRPRSAESPTSSTERLCSNSLVSRPESSTTDLMEVGIDSVSYDLCVRFVLSIYYTFNWWKCDVWTLLILWSFVEDIEMLRDFCNKYCIAGFVITAQSLFSENPLVVDIKSFKYQFPDFYLSFPVFSPFRSIPKFPKTTPTEKLLKSKIPTNAPVTSSNF